MYYSMDFNPTVTAEIMVCAPDEEQGIPLIKCCDTEEGWFERYHIDRTDYSVFYKRHYVNFDVRSRDTKEVLHKVRIYK